MSLFIWPLESEEPGNVICNYAGHHARKSRAPGIDIAAPLYAPILAPATGTVLRSRYTRRAGRSLWLDVGHIRVFLAHLHLVVLLEGEDFIAGDTLALLGCSGQCTTPHLHLSCKWSGEWIDPLRFFEKPQKAAR